MMSLEVRGFVYQRLHKWKLKSDSLRDYIRLGKRNIIFVPLRDIYASHNFDILIP